jgi:hypothetical protein
MDRQMLLHTRKTPGDLLVLPNPWAKVNLAARLAAALGGRGAGEFLRAGLAGGLVAEFMRDFRADWPAFYAIPGDAVPAAPVFPHIGGVTAAMTGVEPDCSGGTVTLSADLDWGGIERLAFDPGNPWIRLAVEVNRALWAAWEEDFLIMPYFHRTPLDAAQGIRGAAVFEDMYDCPDRVKALADWCADWSIALERLLAAEAPRPPGWPCGMWNCCLPPDAVIANGDAVGMISRDMHAEFDRPYTAKFFTATAGGLFHNHAIGLHQVDLVAATPGVIVQEILADPNQPNPAELMIRRPDVAETMVAASIKAPIRLDGVRPDQLDELLPIAARGRFILGVPCDEAETQALVVDKVRAVSGISC